MPLIMTYRGMQAAINYALRGIPFTVRYGLFQNDWQPVHTSLIGDVVPTDFSGYSGLLPIMSWFSPVLIGQRQQCEAPPLVWTRGPGAVSSWVVGYYAVDGGGELLWGEVNPQGSVSMDTPGNEFIVTPRVRFASAY